MTIEWISRRSGLVMLLAVLATFIGTTAQTANADPGDNNNQARPVLLGSSGGNIDDATRLFCCSGTLGALVEDAQGVYILSNNHVLARTNLGLPGESILQPGLIDQVPVCSKDGLDSVATLTDFVPINFDSGPNTVDAAIAAVLPGLVDTSGAIDGIGPVSPTLASAGIGLEVKKRGRTTGLTVGTVSVLDVTVDVTYTKECNKGRQTARFAHQIFIMDSHGDFSSGGDSGALIVVNEGDANDDLNNPRPLGLLFAGSDGGTVANPINEVLGCLGVAMVGGTVDPGLACSHVVNSGNGGGGPPGGGRPVASGLTPGLEFVSAVKAANEDRLFAIRGVVGTGIGVDDNGDPVIEVFLENAARDPQNLIPGELDGVPVRTRVTGAFTAF